MTTPKNAPKKGQQGFQRTGRGASAPTSAAAGNPGSPDPVDTPVTTVNQAWPRYQKAATSKTPVKDVVNRFGIDRDADYTSSPSLYARGTRVTRPYLHISRDTGRTWIADVDEGERSHSEAVEHGRIARLALPSFRSGRTLAKWLADNNAIAAVDELLGYKGGDVDLPAWDAFGYAAQRRIDGW